MQGIWKENIGGWNNKDNKRKKQTRKHTLKEKTKILVRKFNYNDIDNDSIRTECKKIHIVEKEIVKHSEDSFICRVEFKYYIDRKKYSYQRDFFEPYRIFTKICYKLKNNWYDVYNNELIIYDSCKVIAKLEKIHIKYKEPYVISKAVDDVEIVDYYNNTIFVYGKPILPIKNFNIYGFGTTVDLRKFYQKVSNKKSRCNARTWISKKDYLMDTDIKKSSIEKSFSRFFDYY